MYNIKTKDDLCNNSKVLLNSDKQTLEKVFVQDNVGPNSLDEMMRNIHEWYQKESHLPAGQLHDQFVARLLIMRKYSIEKAKQKIDNYYSVRPKIPEFLRNRDPLDPHLNKYLKTGIWIVLPRKTPENHRVTIYRPKSSEGLSVPDIIKVVFMIADYRMWNDSVNGEHLIMDLNNVALQLALQLTPVIISKAMYYLTECFGPVIEGIHLVNLPPFADTILSLVKKLLNPNVVKKIHIYKSFDEVIRKFPENIFPKDLGGTDEITCQDISDAWERTFCSTSWRNYFIEQDLIHSDESMRTIKKNFRDDFGLDGSFKKLSID